jgi:type II secretory ATPase GspE/PulE/Tfp pilus assembly ATPase PilB-like protein
VTAFSYIKHRNTKVLNVDRILTSKHIKGLLAGKDKNKKMVGREGFIFITANNNDVPVPESKTADFYGYRAAYEIVNDAMWRRASTVTFSPGPQEYKVTYYVDGATLEKPAIDKNQMEYFIRFLKNLSNLDINERRKPQKGKFRISVSKETTEWEVASAGSTAGEQVKLKHILKEHSERLTDLGLTPEQYEKLKNLRTLKQGLFVISGPPKSGVTSTLYALLRNHDAFLNSINTLEKQPSTELLNITQNIYSLSDTGTTSYAKKLQTIVRMGPDIVGVADCDDTETAKVACAAAKDSKIMYVTLQADSVLQALGKLLKLVGDKTSVAENLIGISNQRLLRKLCEQCKQAYSPDKELLRKFNLPADKAKTLYRPGKVIYDKRGKPKPCENCQETGFIGRTGIFEIIILNNELKNVIKQAKTLSEIGMQFRRANMLYLQEQGLKKVMAGTTSVHEMIRVLSASKQEKTKQQ